MRAFLLLFLLSFSASAAEFQLRFTGSDGLKWSQGLGSKTNGCTGGASTCGVEKNLDGSPKIISGFKQVRIETSDAAKACEAIGGRLPTLQEYILLVQDFDHITGATGWPKLTTKGWRDIKDYFGDMVRDTGFGGCFWSSSLLRTDEKVAYVFDSDEWGVGVYIVRKHSCQTRCVK